MYVRVSLDVFLTDTPMYVRVSLGVFLTDTPMYVRVSLDVFLTDTPMYARVSLDMFLTDTPMYVRVSLDVFLTDTPMYVRLSLGVFLTDTPIYIWLVQYIEITECNLYHIQIIKSYTPFIANTKNTFINTHAPTKWPGMLVAMGFHFLVHNTYSYTQVNNILGRPAVYTFDLFCYPVFSLSQDLPTVPYVDFRLADDEEVLLLGKVSSIIGQLGRS